MARYRKNSGLLVRVLREGRKEKERNQQWATKPEQKNREKEKRDASGFPAA
jgi:hypothetical protein